MHNKDFENKVQQKMQELRFGPSDEVWMRVEAGIENKKRKRRFAFWMLLPLILGGVTILVVKREASIVKREASGVMREKEDGKRETADVKGERSKVKDKTAVVKNLINKKDIANNLDVTNDSAPSAVKKEKGGKEGNGGIGGKEGNLGIRGKELKEEKIEVIDNSPNPKEEAIEEYKQVAKDSASSAVKLKETKIEEQLIVNESSKKIIKSKSKWSIGLEASAGVSSFSKGLLKPHAQTAGYYYDPVALSNAPNTVAYTPSDVKQGFAFTAGMFARRNISKKLAIKIGVSYMHASTSMKIGQKIDSIRAVNQSNSAMDKVDGYYTVGTSNRYTNKYSMVGLSASLDWHITRRLSWENGINFARLLKSNALHFDGLTGSYYEDDRLFNRNQVLASSSIQFNVLKKISVGPEARFALTDMLKNNANDKKHMRYIGIKSVYILK